MKNIDQKPVKKEVWDFQEIDISGTIADVIERLQNIAENLPDVELDVQRMDYVDFDKFGYSFKRFENDQEYQSRLIAWEYEQDCNRVKLAEQERIRNLKISNLENELKKLKEMK